MESATTRMLGPNEKRRSMHARKSSAGPPFGIRKPLPSESAIQRGKSDSFILKEQPTISNKRSGLFITDEEETSDTFMSRTSSASHQGFSFSIAGPVQLPVTNFGLLSDLAEARRHAAITPQNMSPENNHHVEVHFENSEKHAPSPIFLKFVDVEFKVVLKNTAWRLGAPLCDTNLVEKQILHRITGYVAPGEVLALMGPSGSGKTTLLNLLSGRLQENVMGSITYNDLPFTKGLKQRMGFVRQDDILYPHLTVKETLTYAALLRLPKIMTKRKKLEKVAEVIFDLGLERCQDTIIGGPFLRGISGGERKRVCIGHEILIDPSLLFLDEPTSGLDSTTALRTIQMLHEIAKGGRTIVTTIHQPSSRLYYMFEKLILLAEGHMIYFGKASDAMDYFSCIGFSPLVAMNPADFLLDLANGNSCDVTIPSSLQAETKDCKDLAHRQPASKDVRQYLIEHFEAILEPSEKSRILEINCISNEEEKWIHLKREWTTSWWQQFWVLFVRGFREKRHEYLSWLRIFQVIASAFIIGCLWWQSKLETEAEVQDQVGLVFFIAVFWGFFPLFTAIFTFPQERAILAKERACDMYRLSAYFMARSLGDLPLDLGLPIIFLIIVYFMANLHMTIAAFLLTLVTVFLNVVTAQGLGVAIGAAMMDIKKATTLASVILLTFMLSGGFFVQHIPSFFIWIRYLSFNYHGFRLLVKVQYSAHQTYDCTNDGRCKSLASSRAFHNISLDGGGGEEACIMGIMVVVYRLLAYMALRRMRLGV